MPHGHITRLVPEHGFGFLVDNSGQDWFFLRSGVRAGYFETVWLGERVIFSPEWSRGGPRATDIHFEEREPELEPRAPDHEIPPDTESP